MQIERRNRAICLDADGQFSDVVAPDESGAPDESAAAMLAGTVRTLYILAYRNFTKNYQYGAGSMKKWDGGEDDYGRRFRPIWPKVVAKIIGLGAEPERFIAAQFWLEHGRRPPTPNQLLSEDAVARWQAFIANDAVGGRVQELTQRLYREKLSVSATVQAYVQGARWRYRDALKYAVQNTSVVCASPLLRYCLSSQNDLPELAAVYYDKALLQYMVQFADYDVAWAELIPAALQQDARSLRQRIVGN